MSLEISIGGAADGSGSKPAQWSYENADSPTPRESFASTSVQKWLKTKGASIADVEVEGRMLAGQTPEIDAAPTNHNNVSQEEAEWENGISIASIRGSMSDDLYLSLGYGKRHVEAESVAHRRRVARAKQKAHRQSIAAARRRQSQHQLLLQQKRTRQQRAFMTMSEELQSSAQNEGEKRQERVQNALDFQQSQVEATARARSRNKSLAYVEHKATSARMAAWKRLQDRRKHVADQAKLINSFRLLETLPRLTFAPTEDAVPGAKHAGTAKLHRLRELVARVTTVASSLQSNRSAARHLRARLELLRELPPRTQVASLDENEHEEDSSGNTRLGSPGSEGRVLSRTATPQRGRSAVSRSATPQRRYRPTSPSRPRSPSVPSLSVYARRSNSMRSILCAAADLLSGAAVVSAAFSEVVQRPLRTRWYQMMTDDISRRQKEQSLQVGLIVAPLDVLVGDRDVEQRIAAGKAHDSQLSARLLVSLRRFRMSKCRLCITTSLRVEQLASSGVLAELASVDFPDFVVARCHDDALLGAPQTLPYVVTASSTLELLQLPPGSSAPPINELRLREASSVLMGVRQFHSSPGEGAGRGERVACLLAFAHEKKRPNTAMIRDAALSSSDSDDDDSDSGDEAGLHQPPVAREPPIRWLTDASPETIARCPTFADLEGELWRCEDVLSVLQKPGSRVRASLQRSTEPDVAQDRQAVKKLKITNRTRVSMFSVLVESLRTQDDAGNISVGDAHAVFAAAKLWLPRSLDLDVDWCSPKHAHTSTADQSTVASPLSFPVLRVKRDARARELNAVKNVVSWLQRGTEPNMSFHNVVAFAGVSHGTHNMFAPMRT